MKTSPQFIQSQFVKRKQWIVHRQGTSKINCSNVVFIFEVLMFVRSPLLNMSQRTNMDQKSPGESELSSTSPSSHCRLWGFA